MWKPMRMPGRCSQREGSSDIRQVRHFPLRLEKIDVRGLKVNSGDDVANLF